MCVKYFLVNARIISVVWLLKTQVETVSMIGILEHLKWKSLKKRRRDSRYEG